MDSVLARDGGQQVRVGAGARRAVRARSHEVHRTLGEVAETLASLDSARVWSLGHEALSDSILELHAIEARLAELKAALLVQAERSDLATWDACVNLPAWLRDRAGIAPAAARRQIALARALDTHEAVAAGLARGHFPPASAQAIADAVDALPACIDPEVRARAVAHLVTQARVHDTQALTRLGAHLDEVLDPEGADARLAAQLERAEARAARRTFLRLTHEEDAQTTSGEFRLPLRHGVMLGRMVESFLNPARPDPVPTQDPQTQAPLSAEERRGIAFAELLDRTSASDLPRTGGSPTTVVVTMTLEALLGGLATATTDTGHRITASAARRLAAAHGVIPAVLGTRGEVLDLGRRARFFTPGQRLAMKIQQHGTCAVEHCDRPAAWADANHLQPWHQEGTTDLTNGVLVCPRHHTLADHPAYRTTVLAPGRIRINRRE